MNNKNNVLIVDDNPKNVQIIVSLLVGNGFGVSTVNDGNKVLKACSLKHYDLILLDVMMPIIDGLEICKLLKNNDKFKNIPVIFVTAKTDDDTIKKCFEVGGVDYVVKPFRQIELLARINTHIKLSKKG